MTSDTKVEIASPENIQTVESLLKATDENGLCAVEISEYANLFKRAETYIKKIEKIRDVLVFPAVNELRYAGSHYVQFIERDNIKSKLESLGKAKSHCKRSIYDSVEAGIRYYLVEIKDFQKEFRSTSLLSDSSYNQLMEIKTEAEDFVPGSARNDDEKLEFYEDSMVIFDKLQKTYRTCESKRPEFIKLKNKERRTFFMWATGIIVAITLAAGTKIYSK